MPKKIVKTEKLTKEIVKEHINQGKKVDDCKKYYIDEKDVNPKELDQNPYIVSDNIIEINPFTNLLYNKDYYDLLIKQIICPPDSNPKGLPSGTKKMDLFNHFNKYQAIILEGATGSGKTVLMPIFALEYFITQKNIKDAKVVVTVPKRLAAKNPFPGMLMGVELGEEFGWSREGIATVAQAEIAYQLGCLENRHGNES